MSSTIILLGNGFTIDFLTHMKKTNDIDVVNLFSNGDCVPYPSENEPGFLSFKRCPNLWNLGARPNMDKDSAISLIEDIITCANIASNPNTRHLSSNYINAYQELTSYLKYLFIYYNKKISDEEIRDNLSDWGWLRYLKKLNEEEKCKSISIISYNYDVWLERILMNFDINFEIAGFENSTYKEGVPCKIKIFKPHGSISFSYKDPIEPSQFQITSTVRELTNGKLSDYAINYDELDNLYNFNAIIPPAGDSQRIKSDWAGEIRKLAMEEASKLERSDELIISGISYWHVDRAEIDSILVRINPDINVKMVNPNPSNTLSAVLTCLFSHNITYKNSSILGEL